MYKRTNIFISGKYCTNFQVGIYLLAFTNERTFLFWEKLLVLMLLVLMLLVLVLLVLKG